MVVVADKDTVSGEIRRWSVTNGKCIGCGADFYNNFDLALLDGQHKFNNLPWRPTHPCQNHLYQHSPPWWLIIMLIAHWPTLFAQLVVFHGIYTKDKMKSRELCSTLSPLIAHPPCSPPTRQSGGPPLHRDGFLAWQRWSCCDLFRCFPFCPQRARCWKMTPL